MAPRRPPSSAGSRGLGRRDAETARHPRSAPQDRPPAPHLGGRPGPPTMPGRGVLPMRAALCLVALSLVLSACGEPRRLTYTFTNPNMTEQALLDDKQQLKGTKGVLDVMGKIDDMNP